VRALAELTSHNTGSVSTLGTITLIRRRIGECDFLSANVPDGESLVIWN
jgi:hypothetical protein